MNTHRFPPEPRENDFLTYTAVITRKQKQEEIAHKSLKYNASPRKYCRASKLESHAKTKAMHLVQHEKDATYKLDEAGDDGNGLASHLLGLMR